MTTLTVRVPRSSAGNLLEGAESHLARTSAVTDVEVESIDDLTPRPGTLHVTVDATLTFGTAIATAADARDALTEPVAVERVDAFTTP